VLEKRALESETIQKRIAGKEIKKVIAVPNRLVNVVVK
jgi:leucyl-tRNA synthetase